MTPKHRKIALLTLAACLFVILLLAVSVIQ